MRTIELAFPNVKVPARVYYTTPSGYLAVHRIPGMSCGWGISHVPTGRSVYRDISSLASMREIAKKIDDERWNVMNGADLPKDLIERVRVAVGKA